MKRVVVIDAQGGGIGKQVIAEIVKRQLKIDLIAIGTNSLATNQMLKAGAAKGATGSNPVIVASKDADFIIGPIGIVIADSMIGEITPQMSVAIGQSKAKKLLIPMVNCGNYVGGTGNTSIRESIEDIIDSLERSLSLKES